VRQQPAMLSSGQRSPQPACAMRLRPLAGSSAQCSSGAALAARLHRGEGIFFGWVPALILGPACGPCWGVPLLDQFLLRNCIVFQRRSNFSGHRAAAPARRKGAQQPRESHRGSRSRQPRDPKEPGERGEGGETGSQARGKGKGTRGQLPDSRSRVEARSQSSARRRARARELREPAVKGGNDAGSGRTSALEREQEVVGLSHQAR